MAKMIPISEQPSELIISDLPHGTVYRREYEQGRFTYDVDLDDGTTLPAMNFSSAVLVATHGYLPSV